MVARWLIKRSERHPRWWDIFHGADITWQGAASNWDLALREMQSLDALRYGHCPCCSGGVWPTGDPAVFVCADCCETLLRSELVEEATLDTLREYIRRNGLEHDADYQRLLDNAM